MDPVWTGFTISFSTIPKSAIYGVGICCICSCFNRRRSGIAEMYRERLALTWLDS